jgi:2-keto-3-deoxy-L-rhamnonate aldolase RhmA
MKAFFDRFNRDTYLIIGIESVAAYERLDALISIPGVDGVFVGPHDMTVSMEIPEEYDHSDFVAVLDDIIARCGKAGVGVGAHLSQAVAPDSRFEALIDKGMNWVLYGADVALVVTEMNDRLNGFRKHAGDDAGPSAPIEKGNL